MEEASFSVKIKLELSRIRPKNMNARQAVIAGLFCAAAKKSADHPSLEIKVIPEIREHVGALLKDEGLVFGIDKERIYVSAESKELFARLYGQCFTDDGLRLLPEEPGFAEGFMRGVFLATGYCSDPAKNYRIEFHLENDAIVRLCERMLARWDIEPILKDRTGFTALYFKTGDMVSDFIGHAGATGAMLEFENIRAEKTVSGGVTRVMNCDNGNARRLSDAAAARNNLIKKLMKSPKAAKLTPELRLAAEKALGNPGASIAELGQMMDPPIGKSGMSHRLSKLTEMANSLD
ncbi:MAG: DNA-binding protein WhiA [Saccharofermentans sp.]|nr:DNA-binding protein WhiA [Saccharofermentans sp.]